MNRARKGRFGERLLNFSEIGIIIKNEVSDLLTHEFGMMPYPPEKGRRYDEYEPQKFACISVADDDLDTVAKKLNDVDFYWHTVDEPKKGLAYCGITLIPPSSQQIFADAIGDAKNLSGLKSLLQTAKMFDKWIIHFGI